MGLQIHGFLFSAGLDPPARTWGVGLDTKILKRDAKFSLDLPGLDTKIFEIEAQKFSLDLTDLDTKNFTRPDRSRYKNF